MNENQEDSSWKEEITRIVETIDRNIFTLGDVYQFEGDLQEKFPSNLHIRAKVRQQLQLLRDDGLIEFVDNRGTFRKLFETEEERILSKEIRSQIELGNFWADDKWGVAKRRIGTTVFRSYVLKNFGYSCCVCRFDLERLLEAAHIVKWSLDPDNRLNPSNGLSLCRIHHGAFDMGFLTIDPDLMVSVSDQIRESENKAVRTMLASYEGRMILEPKHYPLLL